MARVHKEIPSLIGGVSQQTAALRFDSQSERISNAWLSTVEGFTQRHPTRHVKDIFTAGSAKGPMFGHTIDRSVEERYQVGVRQGEIVVHDLRGNLMRQQGRVLNYLHKPQVPDGINAYWLSLSTPPTHTPGIADPQGGTNAFRLATTTATATDGVQQNLTPATHRIVAGNRYRLWMWFKPSATLVSTRIQLTHNALGSRAIDLIIDWDSTATFPVPSAAVNVVDTNLPPSPRVDDFGVLPRADGWYVAFITQVMDPIAGVLTMRFYPSHSGKVDSLDVYHMQLEDYPDGQDALPSEMWTDNDQDLADPYAVSLATGVGTVNQNPLEYRRPNPVADPETLSTAGAWTRNASAGVPSPSAVAAPFSGLFDQDVYTTLGSFAGVASGTYQQEVGKFYKGPQIFGLYVRELDGAAAGKADRFTLRMRDSGSTTIAEISLQWTGTVLSITAEDQLDVHASGILVSPYDPKDYMVWFMADTEAIGSTLVAGVARFLEIEVDDFDAGSPQSMEAWGAHIMDGLKAPPEGFLSYMEPLLRARATTVNDFTFITNPNTIVKRGYEKNIEDPSAHRAYIFIKQAGYEKNFKVVVTSQSVTAEAVAGTWSNADSFTPRCAFGTGAVAGKASCELEPEGVWIEPYGGNLNMSASASGSNAAIKLAEVLDASQTWIAASANGSVIEITTDAAQPITDILLKDSDGGDGMILLWREVEEVSDLPLEMRDGWRIKVVGVADDDAEKQPEWVEFQTEIFGMFSKGTWFESTGWGEDLRIDPETLPLALSRRFDNEAGDITGTADSVYFQLANMESTLRRVGDDMTNPFPGMVSTAELDRNISAIFFHEGRLSVLSDEALVMSESNRFFNFHRSTVLELIDSDRISATASNTEVSFLVHAISLDERMILLSERNQFIAEGKPLLSPKTVTIIPKKDFENYKRVEPVKSGRGVFMAFPQQALSTEEILFSGVRELVPTNDADTGLEVDDITEHVPAFLIGEIQQMAVSTLRGVLLCLSNGKVYVYKYQTQGNQTTQAAWSEWDFGGVVLSIGFLRSDVVLTIIRNGSISLELMTLGDNITDPGLQFVVRLDRRVEGSQITAAYDATNDKTNLTIPYAVDGLTMRVVDALTGQQYTVLSAVGSVVSVQGDRTNGSRHPKLYMGVEILTELQFSKPVLQRPGRNGQGPSLAQGRTLVAGLDITHERTSEYEVEVTLVGGYSHKQTFKHPLVGLGGPIGEAQLGSGEFSMTVGAGPEDIASIVLRTTSHLPMRIQNGRWNINYNPRTGRFQG